MLAAAATAQHSPPSSPLDTTSCSPTQDTQLTSRFQSHPQGPQLLQQDVPSGRSDNRLSLPSSQPRSPSAPTVASTSSLPSPSPSPVSSTAAPQRAHRRDDAHVSLQTSFQSGFEDSHHTSSHPDPSDALLETLTTDKNAANTKTSHHHSHHHPNISIDTSKACLQKDDPRAIQKAAVESQPSVNEATRPQRATTISTFPKARPEGQLSFGLKQDTTKAFTPPTSSSSTFPSSTTPSLASTSVGPVSNSSTRPLMMASQSRLSSALPPAPIPFIHHASAPSIHQQQQQEFQSSAMLPSISPPSPRANPALVNSLEQLSVSWKAPEQTPSFPINRLNRSRTISSGVRPNFTSSFSSNGSSNSTVTNSTNPFPNNNIMSPTMVTSSSYSSLPFSPAVAFLSNFVDVTAPRMAPDEEGEQVGDFIMGKVIGHGGFSVVREAFAVHMDGMVARVAVKIVKTQTGLTDNDRVQRMLDKEIAIWSRLSHPNVLPFLAVEKLPTDTFVFCELCSGGHLLDYLMRQEAPPPASASSTKSFSSYTSTRTSVGLEEGQARLIFNQVAEAVRYLHEEKRIVHRDIKLENILQHEDGTWKICDFGLAEYQNDEAASYFGAPLSPTIYNPRNNNNSSNGNSHGNGRAHSPSNSSLTDPDGCSDAGMEEEEDDMVGGSLAYCSPEQLRSQKPLRCPSSDVWSLGVVLYALLTGRLPFQDEYEPRLQFQILNGRYEDPTECSAEARDLLKNMFRSKPEDRWRIGQVIDSPWCMGTMLESSKSSSSNMFSGFGGFSMNTNTSNSNGNSGNGGGIGGGFGGGGFGYRNDDDNGGYNCNTGGDHARMNNFFASFKF
ncbi:MAG: kinase-like domain-containing protein [Benniella sp.]|nr:MAG: kinase-like domain-containing protein [Benniella sp.]